jgi:DNA invertase Pin-like site-specific DNA recombinase
MAGRSVPIEYGAAVGDPDAYAETLIRSRVKAGIDRARANGVHIGRKPTPAKVEAAIRAKLKAGVGMLKIAAECRVGSGTVQRIKREMMAEAAT